ncbi:MAG: HAD family phosphatase [Phycisphaerae bacterium]
MNRRAVIFDMDGVLVDSYQAHFKSWQRLAAAHGLAMTEQQFASGFGRTGREIVRSLWDGRFTESQVLAVDAEKEVYYRQVLAESFPEMPGADALLRQLHEAGFALAIGSSGPPENVQAIVAGLREGKLFDATVNGMDVHRGKPDPEIFLLAASKLGIPPACCAVIEDAPAGVQAAKAAGMVAVALTGTVQAGQLSAADIVVDSLTALSPRTISDLIDRHRAAATAKI